MLFKNVCQITEIDRIAYDSQTNKFEEEEKKMIFTENLLVDMTPITNEN